MLAYPDEPVDMGQYGKHEAFLVECRSLSGFSGSPVFLTTDRTIFAKDGKLPEDRKYTGSYVIDARKFEEKKEVIQGDGVVTGKFTPISVTGVFGPWFIGIDRGHVPLWKPVYE